MFKKKETEKQNLAVEKIDTPTQVAFKNFFRNKLAVTGLIVFVSIFLFVFIGSSVMSFDAYYNQPVLKDIQPGKGYINFPSELNGQNIKEITSGVSFSAALTEEGKVYVWGKDIENVLTIPENIQKVINSEKVVDIAAGDRHIVILTENEKVYGWGYNSFQQANIDSLLEEGGSDQISCPPGGCPDSMFEGKPSMIIQNSDIKSVEAGDQTTGILTTKGQLVVWGAVMNNGFDKVPKSIQGRIQDFKMSTNAIVVLLDDGTVDVYGVVGAVQKYYLPKELTDGSVNVVQIDVSYNNAMALDDKGNVYVWGPSSYPIMDVPEFSSEVLKIQAAREHATALLADGSVVTWGTNFYGETGMPQLSGVKNVFSDMYQNYTVDENNQLTAWGNDGFVLGSDNFGRDLLSRLLHGGRVSLTVGAIAVIIEVIIGVIVGMIAGFKGGRIDNLLMRMAEIVGSFPFYPLVITLSAMLPPGTKPQQKLIMIMVILGLTGWTGIARLVRGQILQEREKDFVLAARSLGIKEKNIIVRHILPNVMNIVIVQITLGYASSLLSEAGLSFLGFGVPFPYPSWGNMLSDAQSPSVIEKMWWRWVFPGFMVFLTALSVNIIGDGLRDALDPKSNER